MKGFSLVFFRTRLRFRIHVCAHTIPRVFEKECKLEVGNM